MSIRSRLLHLMLAFALVLNGSGYAFAAVHMQPHHMATVGAPDAELCHEHGDAPGAAASAVKPDPDATAGSATLGDAATGHTSGSCCTVGACHCAGALNAGLADSRLLAPLPVASRLLSLEDTTYLSPALPRLIRPPIC